MSNQYHTTAERGNAWPLRPVRHRPNSLFGRVVRHWCNLRERDRDVIAREQGCTRAHVNTILSHAGLVPRREARPKHPKPTTTHKATVAAMANIKMRRERVNAALEHWRAQDAKKSEKSGHRGDFPVKLPVFFP